MADCRLFPGLYTNYNQSDHFQHKNIATHSLLHGPDTFKLVCPSDEPGRLRSGSASFRIDATILFRPPDLSWDWCAN